MKMLYRIAFFLILLSCGWFQGKSQTSLDRVNFAYQYDPLGEIFVSNHVSLAHTDSIILFCNLYINETEAVISDYKFNLFYADSYSAELQTIVYDSSYIGSRGNSHYLKFSIPIWPTNKVVILQVNSGFSQIDYYYDIQPAEITPLHLLDQSKVPLTTTWARADNFRISRSGIALYYDYYFEPALPPMVTRAPDPSKQMQVGNMINYSDSSTFRLNREGLYLFQKDTSESRGLPLMIVDKYFPKPAKLDQLIDPLIYITQREEWEILDSDSVTKRDFDQYWLGMTKSTDRAKKVIKTYYDRIEEANQFFTTYKEGWKTDRGMIYAVFGVPDRVIRASDKETWYYNATSISQAIDFEFIRVNSIFSNNHYVLIRDRRYSNVWYQEINNLRKVRY